VPKFYRSVNSGVKRMPSVIAKANDCITRNFSRPTLHSGAGVVDPVRTSRGVMEQGRAFGSRIPSGKSLERVEQDGV